MFKLKTIIQKMCNTNNTANAVTGFSQAYELLPFKYQLTVRDDIMKECGWKSRNTFHNKKRGIQPLKPPEILIIERHFSKHDLNPWTGKKLS